MPGHERIEIVYVKQRVYEAFSQMPGIVYVRWGSVEAAVGTERFSLQMGELLVVNAWDSLRLIPDAEGETVFLKLDIRHFCEEFGLSERARFVGGTSLEPGSRTVRELTGAVKELLELYEEGAPNYYRLGVQNKIFSLLFLHFQAAGEAGAEGVTHSVRTAVSYMEAHYGEKLRIAHIAEQCFLSEGRLSHLFQEQLHTTPYKCLTAIRLREAVELLARTELRVSEVAERTGFQTDRNLNAAFREKYGCLPWEWRKRISGRGDGGRTAAEQKPVRHEGCYGEEQTRELFFPEISAAAQGEPFPEEVFSLLAWHDTEALLGAEGRSLLSSLCETSGYKNIFLLSIFGPELLSWVEGGDGEPIWIFNKLDSILDFLLKEGLKPVLSITSVPEVFPSAERFFRFNVGIPADIAAWENLVTSFFEHILGRYGNQVRDWSVAVWMMREVEILHPMDEEKPLPVESPLWAEFDFYKATCEAIRRAVPEIKMGSPLLSDAPLAFNCYYRRMFIRYAQTHGCLPDYYVCYDESLYPREGKEEGRERLISLKASAFREKLCSVLEDIRRLTGESPRICLLDLTATLNGIGDFYNDTPYCSAAQAALALSLPDEVKWAAVGRQREVFMLGKGDGMEFGGSAAGITVHGIVKPTYYFQEFLTRLRGTVLFKDEAGIILREGETFRILLCNHEPQDMLLKLDAVQKTPLFSMRHPVLLDAQSGEPFWPDPERRYDRAKAGKLSVRIRLRSLKYDSYQLKSWIINRESGSAYDKWLEMGSPAIDEEIVEYLNAAARPALHFQKLRTEKGKAVLHHVLLPMEVYYAELRPEG